MPDGLGWGPLSPLGPVPKGTDHRLILPISCTSNLPMQTETQPNPNQVHFFTVTNGKLYGKLNWRITEPDGEFFTRDTVQRFVQDPEKPAILYNHDNEYLHYQASSKMKTRETWGRTIFFFMCMHAHAFLVAWLLECTHPPFLTPPPPPCPSPSAISHSLSSHRPSPTPHPTRAASLLTACSLPFPSLVSQDDWYILDYEPQQFIAVYYRGRNDAWVRAPLCFCVCGHTRARVVVSMLGFYPVSLLLSTLDLLNHPQQCVHHHR